MTASLAASSTDRLVEDLRAKKNIETEHTVAAKQDHIILFQMGAKGKGFYPYW